MEGHQAQTLHSLVIREKLRTAVRWMMDQEKVGVLHPGDWCTKMGHQVMEVMFSKHSEAQAPTTASLDS